MSDGKTLAIMGAVCFVFGGIALVYSLSLGFSARDFQSAAACSSGTQTTGCLEHRTIAITDTGTGRWGEVNAVDFLDEGNLSAILADGVLTVSIPKQAKAKPIKIQVGNGSEAKQLKE